MSLSKLPFQETNKLFNKTVSDKVYKTLINEDVIPYLISLINTTEFGNRKNLNNQKKIYINTYVLPLLYVIYSYAYSKYNIECEKKIVNSHCLNQIYNLEFMFAYHNPIIHQVNIYFYKKYFDIKNNNKNQQQNNSGDNNLSKIIGIKEKMIIPLEEFISLLENENKKYTYYEKVKKKIEELESSLSNLKNAYSNKNKLENIKLNTTNNSIKTNIEHIKKNITYLINYAIDIIDKSNKKTSEINKIKSYLKQANDLLIYYQILVHLGTPEKFDVFINIFEKANDIYSSQIASYKRISSNKNKNTKPILEKKIQETTTKNMASLCTELAKLKGNYLSESFYNFFKKNNSNNINIKFCESFAFNKNSNSPTKKIPDNSPYYNIAGYMTQLFIYDMLLNQQYIQNTFHSNNKKNNFYNSQDLLKEVKSTQIDIETELDALNKKQKESSWSLQDIINKQKKIYGTEKGEKPIKNVQNNYFDKLDQRKDLNNKINLLKQSPIDDLRKYQKAYNIIKNLSNSDSKNNTLLKNENKKYLTNLISGKNNNNFTKKQIIDFLNEKLQELNNNNNIKNIFPIIGFKNSSFTLFNLNDYIKAYDKKLNNLKENLNKIPITSTKEQYSTYLTYIFYDLMSKELTGSSNKNKVPDTFQNNFSYFNKSKQINQNASKLITNLTSSFVTCDATYNEFLTKIKFKQQDNKLKFLLTNDKQFDSLLQLCETGITNEESFQKLKKETSAYLQPSKKSNNTKDLFMNQIKSQNKKINDPAVQQFFENLYQQNQTLMNELTNVVGKKAIFFLNNITKGNVENIKIIITNLNKKIADEKEKKNILTNTKNMIYIYPYTDVFYLYFLVLSYIKLILQIS